MNVNCPAATAGAPMPVELDVTTAGVGFAMTGPSGPLTYGLFADNTYATEFTEGTHIPYDVTNALGAGLGDDITIYGLIDAGQNVSAGLYSQQVLVTLTY